MVKTTLSGIRQLVKPMVLTESGKRLYRQVLPAMKITQEAMEQVREENYLFSDLRIGFLESMSLLMAPQFLSFFKKKVGRITCLTGSSDRLLECLRTHDLDIIISSDPALRYSGAIGCRISESVQV